MAARTVVTIQDSASAALIDTSLVFKTVVLPTATPGRFIYVADSNGFAQNSTVWISTGGTGLSIVGAVLGPGGMPVINRNYGAMAFLANGNSWYTIISEGGIDSFATIYTSSIVTSSFTSQNVSTTTIWAQTLNLAGSFSPTGGVATTNVSANTISTNLITACNVSTNSISTNNAYVTTLYAGATVISNTFGVTGATSLSNTLSVVGNYTTILGGTLAVSNTVSTNLITASNISTNSISTNNAYITTLTVGSETDSGGLSVGGTVSTNLITACNISSFSISTNSAYAATLYAGATVISNTLGVTGATSLSNNLNVVGNYTTILGGTLAVSNTVSTNLITASNISTNSISTNNAYITTLIVGSETDSGGLSVGGTVSTNLITASNISTNSISTNYGFISNVSTFNIGICNNAFVTNNMNVGANVSSLSLNTGNISSGSLYSISVTNNSSFTASVQGNSISSGKLYASAVYYNVQTL